MLPALQIGKQGDWNNGPLADQIDKPCKESPPDPLGGRVQVY